MASAIIAPNLVIGGRYRTQLGDLLFGVSRLGEFVQRPRRSFHGGLDAFLSDIGLARPRSSGLATIAQASTVAVVVPSPATRGLLATSLTNSAPMARTGPRVDVLRDRYTVVGDRGLPLLSKTTVAALGSERDSNGIGQLVHAAL